MQKDLKTYQSVQKKDLSGYNQQEKKNIVSSALRYERKDISVKKTVTYKHFKRACNVFFFFSDLYKNVYKILCVLSNPVY